MIVLLKFMSTEKTKPKDTLVATSEYWRLRAEVFALREFLSSTYVHSLGFHDPDSEDFLRVQERFDGAFEKVVATQLSRMLCSIEDISPRLAASLDDREQSEIEADL